MKKLQIISKAKADKILVDSLFNPVNGRTLNRMKLDNGKYKPGEKYIGREVQASDGVLAVYPVSRNDNDGAYTQLMCVCIQNG